MHIVNILGGLGNQMFQYAFAYTLSKDQNSMVKLDIHDFEGYDLREYELDIFNVSLPLATQTEVNKLKYKNETLFQKVLRKIKRRPIPFTNSYYREPHFHHDDKVLSLTGDIYFEGYWQSEKYFLKYKNDLLKEFTLKKGLHSQSQNYMEQIISTEAVSLHIRRGDYVTNQHTNSVHGTCPIEYYQKAVQKIEEGRKAPHFFIFSDDLEWAKDNLSFIENLTFIELDANVPDHEEMILMSKCQHNIIANSSFSWWGAWLNQNENNMVIAPKKWFNDSSKNTKNLIPSGWIKL